MASVQVFFTLVAMAMLFAMPLPGQAEVLTYNFVSLGGDDYFKGTFSYDTSGDPHRQLVPFSFTEHYGSEVLAGFAVVYIATNSGIVRLQFCSGSFGHVSAKDGNLLEYGNLALYFSNITTNLSQPLPLPILPKSNYQWWNGSGSLLSATLRLPPQGNEQLQGQNLARRDQIFTLVLLGIGVLVVLRYAWRYRQLIADEVKLLTNEIKPILNCFISASNRAREPVRIDALEVDTEFTYSKKPEWRIGL